MKTILHTVDLKAAPKKVFDALTTTTGLAGWWTSRVSGDASPGGLIAFRFADGFDPDMRVTELASPSRVEWKCVGGVDQWADNTFMFEFTAAGGGTRLRFRQDYATELSDDYYGSYNFNWGYYLESLRLYCDTGSGKPFQASGRSDEMSNTREANKAVARRLAQAIFSTGDMQAFDELRPRLRQSQHPRARHTRGPKPASANLSKRPGTPFLMSKSRFRTLSPREISSSSMTM